MSNLPHDLILSLVKLTVILLLACIAAPLIKRPAMRASFWSAIFIILPIAILITHGRSLIDLLPAQTQVESVGVIRIEALPQPSTESATEPLTQNHSMSTLAWVFLAGLGAAILPIFISLVRLAFIQKQVAPAHLAGVLAQIEGRDAGHTPVYLCSHPAAPCVVGLLRACILLPETARQWNQRRLRSTLLHEAAHIRRKDPAFRFIASLVRAVFWFHPLIWLAYRQLVAAQEQACDAAAIDAGIEPADYAEDLLHSVNFDKASAEHCLSMARWSQVGSRVHSILHKQSSNKPTDMKKTKLMITAVTTMTFALASIGYSENPEAQEPQAEDATIAEAAVVAPEEGIQVEGDAGSFRIELDAVDLANAEGTQKTYIMVSDGKGGYVMKEVLPDKQAGEGERAEGVEAEAPAHAVIEVNVEIAEEAQEEIEGAD